MKSFIRFASVLLVVGMGLSAQTYDVSADWNNGANPNGVWSYREGSNLLGYIPAWAGMGVGAVSQSAYANAPGGSGHVPSIFKSVGGYYYLDVLVGDVVVHSRDNGSGGVNGEGSIRWTAPAAGVVGVSGTTWMPRDLGRHVTWSILVDGLSVTSGAVFSGDPHSRANPFPLSAGTGGHASLTNIPVVAGSTIAYRLVTTQAGAPGDFAAVDLKITYGPTDAQSILVGSGCGGMVFPPALATTLPIIAAPCSLTLTNGTPNSAGDLYVAGIPGLPFGVGGGCTVYLDLVSAFVLMPIATNAGGAWNSSFFLPNIPGLSGAQVALQGVLVGTGGPLGVDLTNGVNLTIGY